MPARPELAQSATLALGQRAPLVAVRFTEPAHLTGVATVCAAPLPREAADVGERVPLDDAAYFGGGWHPLERAGTAPFRWTARRAVTLLPARAPARSPLAIVARPAAPAPVTISAVVNGSPLATLAMGPGDRDTAGACRAASGWTGPTSWCSSLGDDAPVRRRQPDARELGVAVTSLRILRD